MKMNNLMKRTRSQYKRKELINLSTYSLINFKPAFTLAEILITLAIIGVVSAMTIPELMNNYKARKLRSQFLKSYSLVQQAFKHMEADDVSLDPSTYPSSTFYKTFMKYFTGTTDCGRAGKKKCGGNNYKGLDGTSGSIENEKYGIMDDGQFMLKDGTLILLENDTYRKSLWVHVDINGYNNPPNMLGYDLFTFDFLDGELKTMGDKGTKYNDLEKYCNFESKVKFNGIACAYKAKTDSEYFKTLIKKFK